MRPAKRPATYREARLERAAGRTSSNAAPSNTPASFTRGSSRSFGRGGWTRDCAKDPLAPAGGYSLSGTLQGAEAFSLTALDVNKPGLLFADQLGNS